MERGINNIVVHPASIQVSARDRVKTDKRDSLKMAKQLSNCELKPIRIPSIQREHFRILTRTRETLVDGKKRVGNQLKSLLHTQGLIGPGDHMKIGKAWIKKVLEYKVGKDVKYCIETFVKMWLDFDGKIKELMKKIAEQAVEDENIDSVYRSVPGIGALSARILSNELEDMKCFSNEKNIFSYTGLTPSEYSSGEHKHLGCISRQGKSLLRKILVQIAWRSIKFDKRLLGVFERIAKKAGRKRAIVAIARRIIGCIRACFLKGKKWCTNAPAGKNFLTTKAEAC